jgi:elongation factor Ts
MSISAVQVKALRDRTGAGMMDCKNALIEAGGNEEDALSIIQKKGLAKVAKRAGAIAAEGLVHGYIHPGSRIGVLVEVNCQTDFVARNEDFIDFVNQLSMHIASESPTCVRADELDEAEVAKQRDIFLGQLEEEAKTTGKEKPAAAIEKIVEGKLGKWRKETVLMDQVFVLADNKETINQILEALSAKIGEKLSIRRFVRYELGEGLEKRKNDLAADVAQTLGES